MDDAQSVRATFTYCAATGVLCRNTGSRAGQPCGHPDKDGYLRVSFNGKKQRVHRLVWLYVHGAWPNIVDHVNHDKLDNRIDNLRSVTRLENQRNRALSANNRSGVSGVHWSARNHLWVAHIKVQGVIKNLGGYRSYDDAVATRRVAEIANGFHVNHGRAA